MELYKAIHTILNKYNTSTHPELSVATILGKLGKEEKYHEWLNVPGNLKNEDNQKAVLAMLETVSAQLFV